MERAERIKRAAGRVLLTLSFIGTALTSGCSFLLPSSQDAAKSKWTSYTEAKDAFDQIMPGVTDTNDLVELGFHFAANPNARLLTYLDVIERFMPNRVIDEDDLDPAVREFIAAGDEGQAWEIDLDRAKAKRKGNAFLDIFGFKKITHATGWRFKTIFLIRDGFVVYKLSSGIPNVDIDERRIRPLGPFQELDRYVASAEEREKKSVVRDAAGTKRWGVEPLSDRTAKPKP